MITMINKSEVEEIQAMLSTGSLLANVTARRLVTAYADLLHRYVTLEADNAQLTARRHTFVDRHLSTVQELINNVEEYLKPLRSERI